MIWVAMLVYEKTAIYPHRELRRIEKNAPFCLCVRAHHALRALITRKLLRSTNAQYQTEEST